MKQISKTTEIFLKKKKVCGIWFNVKVTFLQLCYKEILGESHCCGRMRNEEEKQILPLRVIILYKLLGTSVLPEPWAGGGMQPPLTTAAWQGMVWKSGLGACLLCPMQSALSKGNTQGWAAVSTNRFLWIAAIYACPDICSAGRQAGAYSSAEQEIQCLPVWLHGLMTSGLDLSSSWHKTMAKKL